jgi:hypothetical protein
MTISIDDGSSVMSMSVMDTGVQAFWDRTAGVRTYLVSLELQLGAGSGGA